MSENDSNLVWKIAGGIVLGLLFFNAIERYQQREAMAEGMKELQRIAADPDPMGLRAQASHQQVAASISNPTIRPVPPGFRCMQGTLLKQVDGGWTQITSRNNEWYCPHGGTVSDCYEVSATTTGCK